MKLTTKAKRKTYGYNRVKLSEAYPVSVLIEMAEEIRLNPENKNTDGSVWVYSSRARKRLDDISWAIYYLTKNPPR